MASARYWRAVTFTTAGGGDMELSELQLHDSGGRVDASATITSSFAPSTGALADLYDNSAGASVRWAAADVRQPGFAVNWDFGSSTSVTHMLVGGGGSNALYPLIFFLRYSSDGIDWSEPFMVRPTYPGASTLGTASEFYEDQHFANVVALLHGDGADLSTAYTDVSVSPRTYTGTGGASISTTQSKFGGASIHLTGGYVSTPAASAFAFGTDDFTIEFWAWKSGAGAGNYDSVCTTDTTNGSAASGWLLELGTVRGFALAANGALIISNNPTINDSAWHHWAITRAANTFRLFKDGALLTSVSTSVDMLAAGPFGIGRNANVTSYPFAGYIDDLRITKGVARYTAAFTAPTAAFHAAGSLSPLPLTTKQEQSFAVAGSAVGDVVFRDGATSARARDIEHDGLGTISGTVKIDSTPDIPVKRRVRLVRDRDGLFARETWSDETTGEYEFTEIAEQYAYSVISYDHTHDMRAVIADNLTPEVA